MASIQEAPKNLPAQETGLDIQPYPGARREDGGVIVENYITPSGVGFSRETVTEAREKKILEGKVILVVGASYYGIGGSAAREAALQGATVVISSRNRSVQGPFANLEGAKLLQELTSLGSEESDWIFGDISNAEDRKRVIDEMLGKFGKIDGIVITPALLKDNIFMMMSEDNMREAWETNFWGPAMLIKDATRKMRKTGGKIVAVSSLAAVSAPFQAEYGPAKAALDNLIKSLHLEQGKDGRPVYPGLYFNAVAPGLVDTPIVADLTQEQREMIVPMTLADRELLPQEVGELIAHLLSPETEANGKVVSIIGVGPKPELDDRNLIADEPSFRPASQKPEYIRLNTKWIRRVVSPDYVQRAREAEEQMVLDLGCSVGNNTRPIRDIFEEEGIKATIIGGDIDDASLRIARKEVTGKGNVRVNFEHVDATDMPFQPETFDKIFLWNMWQEIPDRQGAMFQVARVVKPGGEVEILTSFTDRAYPSSHDGMMLGRLKRKTKEILGIEEKGNRVDESRFKPIVIEEAIGMIREAGLEIDDNPNLEENADISIETEELSPEFMEAMAGDIKFNEGFFEDILGAMDIPFWKRRDALIQAIKEKKAEAEAKGQKYIFNRNWVLFRARKPEVTTVSRTGTVIHGSSIPLESPGSIY